MAAERQFLEHGFGPFYRSDSRLLILGSFPSVKSREAAFFYGHPQNRFWRILAAVFSDALPVSLEEKSAFLARHQIALYDVIASYIFTNGSLAYSLYMKHIFPMLGIPAVRLPSSSPANAAWTLQRLTEAWAEALWRQGGAI